MAAMAAAMAAAASMTAMAAMAALKAAMAALKAAMASSTAELNLIWVFVGACSKLRKIPIEPPKLHKLSIDNAGTSEINLQIFKQKSSRAESKKLQHHHKIVERNFVAKSAPKIIVHNRRQQLVKASA
jgi:hypothetical protein